MDKTVTYDFGGTAAAPVIPTSVTLNTLLVPILVRQRQFRFRIAAQNELGLGEWSEYASLTDAPKGFCLDAPITPLNPKRHTDTPTAGKIKIQWDAIADEFASGGDDVANIMYEVYGGAVDLVLLADTSDNFYEQDPVPAGSTFKFKVRSKNRSGQPSAFTAVMNLISASLPAMPPTLTLTSTTPNQVNMVWTVPADGGSPIIRYEVTRTGLGAYENVANSLLTTTLAGLAGGATLTFEVRAVTAVGAGPSQTATIVVAQ